MRILARRKAYKGEVVRDRYGREIPKHAHGTLGLGRYTSSSKLIREAAAELFDRLVDKRLLVRRLNISAEHVISEADARRLEEGKAEQLDLFTDYAALEADRQAEEEMLKRERRAQEAEIEIRKRFGKNAILKGMNFEDGATQQGAQRADRRTQGMNETSAREKYRDIIDLPHHVSRTRPQMPVRDRAAQFSPFAALTGYGEVINESSRATDARQEQSEDDLMELDIKQRYLLSILDQHPEITVTYFVPDEKRPAAPMP